MTGPVRITKEGLIGDAQADRRVHGGPEKAVHHYAGENYAKLAQRFPEIADALAVGIGENVFPTFGFDENSVCISATFSASAAPCCRCRSRDGRAGRSMPATGFPA